MTRTLSRRRVAPRDVQDPSYEEDDNYREEYEEEEERPRRQSRSRQQEPPSRRRSRRDEEEEERPRRPRRSRDEEKPQRGASRGSGWNAYKDQRAKNGGGKDRLTVKDNEVIIKFLEDEPFAVYEQHWVGNRSYTCPGAKCPLCERGYDTRYLTLFNVVDMKSGTNLYWEAGPNAADKIQKASEGKYSPLAREDIYYLVERSKKSNNFYEFAVTPVKERDLEDDFGLAPLDGAELDEALDSLFDESVIPFTSTRDLRALADEDDD